jgi:very-short-patch-repair endonuclease
MKRSRARSEEAIEFARTQRASANEFAATVWQWIRNRKCYGQKFRREYPIPPYTLDFCCVELRLVIEIDGQAHLAQAGSEQDRQRDAILNRLGYQVQRIPGYAVLNEPDDVAAQIRSFVKSALEKPEPLTPDPSPRSGARGEKPLNKGSA